MAEESEGEIPPGRRKNGKPYKHGNTRPDGSYKVGDRRPSPDTQFAKGDGRKRGRRTKGTRNLATEWREELAEMIEITEGGKKKRVSKLRGIVKATAVRAMKSSARDAEIAFRHAGERDENAGAVRLSDREIIDRWMAQELGSANEPKVTDDRDGPDQPESGADDLDQ